MLADRRISGNVAIVYRPRLSSKINYDSPNWSGQSMKEHCKKAARLAESLEKQDYFAPTQIVERSNISLSRLDQKAILQFIKKHGALPPHLLKLAGQRYKRAGARA